MRLWDLPGARRFVESAGTSLRRGSNVVVRFAGGVPDGFEDALTAALGNTLHVSHLIGTAAPFDDLCRRYAQHPAQVHSLADLCDDAGFRGRLIHLDGLDGPAWSAWREFLGHYAHACRSQSLIGRTLFLVLLTGHPPPEAPQGDVALTNLAWDGVLDDIDLLLFASERLRDRSDHILLRTLLATVVAKVASWDFETAATLVEERDETILDPVELLRSSALAKGWTSETPLDWGLGTASGSGTAHPARAAIDGAPTEIGKRLWSAQLSVLLPWLETRRHETVAANVSDVRRLLRRSGGADASPYELEFKDLFWLFSRDRADGHLRRTIKRLRDARNELAHRRHLSADAVLDLVQRQRC